MTWLMAACQSPLGEASLLMTVSSASLLRNDTGVSKELAVIPFQAFVATAAFIGAVGNWRRAMDVTFPEYQ